MAHFNNHGFINRGRGSTMHPNMNNELADSILDAVVELCPRYRIQGPAIAEMENIAMGDLAYLTSRCDQYSEADGTVHWETIKSIVDSWINQTLGQIQRGGGRGVPQAQVGPSYYTQRGMQPQFPQVDAWGRPIQQGMYPGIQPQQPMGAFQNSGQFGGVPFGQPTYQRPNIVPNQGGAIPMGSGLNPGSAEANLVNSINSRGIDQNRPHFQSGGVATPEYCDPYQQQGMQQPQQQPQQAPLTRPAQQTNQPYNDPSRATPGQAPKPEFYPNQAPTGNQQSQGGQQMNNPNVDEYGRPIHRKGKFSSQTIEEITPPKGFETTPNESIITESEDISSQDDYYASDLSLEATNSTVKNEKEVVTGVGTLHLPVLNCVDVSNTIQGLLPNLTNTSKPYYHFIEYPKLEALHIPTGVQESHRVSLESLIRKLKTLTATLKGNSNDVSGIITELQNLASSTNDTNKNVVNYIVELLIKELNRRIRFRFVDYVNPEDTLAISKLGALKLFLDWDKNIENLPKILIERIRRIGGIRQIVASCLLATIDSLSYSGHKIGTIVNPDDYGLTTFLGHPNVVTTLKGNTNNNGDVRQNIMGHEATEELSKYIMEHHLFHVSKRRVLITNDSDLKLKERLMGNLIHSCTFYQHRLLDRCLSSINTKDLLEIVHVDGKRRGRYVGTAGRTMDDAILVLFNKTL